MNQSEREAQLRPLQLWDARAMTELASLSRLRLWKFAAKSSFETGILSELSRLPILQFLSFEESEIESASLRALATIASLRRLDLKGCRFAAEDFNFLCEQWARGACPRLQEVWLEGTVIGDDELQTLGRVERLRSLDLKNTTISDVGLKHLHGLKKLNWLFLLNTSVSDAGVMELAVLPQLSGVGPSDGTTAKKVGERLFLAQVALKKSTKPINRTQLDAADARLRAFLEEREVWEREAYRLAMEIRKRHEATRPNPHEGSPAEIIEEQEFWRNLNAQKAAIAARYCSQKLLVQGAGRADSYGNPPWFQRADRWLDYETPSRQKTIFYGSGRSNSDSKRRYTLVLEDGDWKLNEVQWWSGGWKRDIV